jgi:hypothetical protein
MAATVHLYNSIQIATQEGTKKMQTYAGVSYSFRLKPCILQALVALLLHSTPKNVRCCIRALLRLQLQRDADCFEFQHSWN